MAMAEAGRDAHAPACGGGERRALIAANPPPDRVKDGTILVM